MGNCFSFIIPYVNDMFISNSDNIILEVMTPHNLYENNCDFERNVWCD